MTETGREIAAMFARKLELVAEEVAAFPDESDLWRVRGDQKNAPGTLVNHLAGNLRHYVGAGLGGTAYARDREREFAETATPRPELLRRLEGCRDEIVPVLEGLSTDDLAAPYPGGAPTRFGEITTGAFLLHLSWHLGWHHGQIRYARLGGS